MKKKILLVAALTICLAVLASGTLAYFTAENTAHNVITSGGVNIAVAEKTRGEGDTLVDFPAEGISGVMPGADVSKIVTVENIGSSEAWIRVKVESAITAADGSELNADVISYEVGDNWKLQDGYYYYASPVPAKAATEELFNIVHFAPSMGNEYQNCTANIVISAQAVQTANNGQSAPDAEGWPSEVREG